jgi:hypothetical protein
MHLVQFLPIFLAIQLNSILQCKLLVIKLLEEDFRHRPARLRLAQMMVLGLMALDQTTLVA